jgi:hypothetical protein
MLPAPAPTIAPMIAPLLRSPSLDISMPAMAPMSPPITVPAVVLLPGLLLAALSGVTQPDARNKTEPTRVGKISIFFIYKSFVAAIKMKRLILIK